MPKNVVPLAARWCQIAQMGKEISLRRPANGTYRCLPDDPSHGCVHVDKYTAKVIATYTIYIHVECSSRSAYYFTNRKREIHEFGHVTLWSYPPRKLVRSFSRLASSPFFSTAVRVSCDTTSTVSCIIFIWQILDHNIHKAVICIDWPWQFNFYHATQFKFRLPFLCQWT